MIGISDSITHSVSYNYKDIPTYSLTSLNFFYANVRSICKSGKFDELKCILKATNCVTHLIILTETWIKNETEAKSFHLPNYTHIYNYRPDKRGGGVSIFVHRSLQHELSEEIHDTGVHYLWIYLKKFALHVGAIYNPDKKNINKFLEKYSLQLENKKRGIVFGDYNIDLLSDSRDTSNYMDVVKIAGYDILNKIDENYCTRETITTKTILDHVSSNLHSDRFHLTIMETPMSDHKQIYVELLKYKHNTKQRNSYEAIDYPELYKHMKTIEIDKINKDHNYNTLELHLQQQVKQHKTTKVKILNLPQDDWINKTIITGINKRNVLWQQVKENPNNKEIEKEFTKEKNHLHKIIKRDKKTFYYTSFKNCNNDPKKIWNLINTLANNKIKLDIDPPKLIINDNTITDGNDICEKFNNFFSSIGVELANKIAKHNHSDTFNTMTYSDKKPKHTLTNFDPCTLDEISKIINSLDSNCSTGIDGINTKTIKCLSEVIGRNLTDCINKCMDIGIFPDTLKVAKISPIYKSGAKSDPGNYRPISILPVISKIFEKVVHKRISEHLTKLDFLYNRQYGFRPRSSTLSAVTDLVTKINTEIDQKNIVLGIFIDLKKAFDTVSHSLLLAKLNDLGISGSAYKLLESYLTNRTQVVRIGTFTSNPHKIECGIPQGSILGPMLFLIYVNNISKIDLMGQITLYADDTCLFYFGKNLNEIVSEAQNDLNKYNTWCQSNLLTINTKKTSFIIFSPKNKKIPDFPPLTINNDTLLRSNQEKYLGLLLDEKLSWKPHINSVKNKMTSLTGAMRRISNCVPHKTRLMIYNALVKSNLDYLIEIWGCAAKTNLKPLQISQNKVIKILFHYDKLTHTPTLYKKTNLLNLNQIYTQNICILIKKIMSGQLHSQTNFIKRTYKHNLRNTNKLKLHAPRTDYGKRNILYDGTKIFNNLPSDVKEITSIHAFKAKLKVYVCENIE